MIRTELIAPVSDLLHRQAREQPDKIAYWDARRKISYGGLHARTGRIAANLVALGLEDGDRVAVFLANSVDWVESCMAILRAGGVVVPISFDATEAEIRYRLDDATCRIVITSDTKAAMVGKLKHELSHVETIIFAGDHTSSTDLSLAALADAVAATPPDPGGIDQVSFIVYTSGTTGRAKGVLLSQRSLLWVTAACWAPICGLTADDVVLSPLPLFHSYALSLSVLSVLAVGASEHIVEKFSTDRVLELLQTGTYTVFPGVPTMFHYLAQRADEARVGVVSGLRLCISAGAILPAALNRAFEARFGVTLIDGYGITETSTMVTMNWMGDKRPFGSCGLPVPGLAVRIVDPVTREDVAFGAEGELIVRGPNLMLGYHNKPAETAASLRGGWYHTGDLARSDLNGFLTITGRLKELIIRGGQNIAPAEIEDVVVRHPQVLDCAVVGVSHASLGEVPNLFVVAKKGGLDLDALLEHCRAHLSAYKIPEKTHLVDEIPRTGSGKIMRFKLLERIAARTPGPAS